jgi:surface polysaccharide O-acyltransferase-like enzyme
MITNHAPAPPTERLYFLDALRIAAFALLVLFHVGMYYVSWPWHVKSPLAGSALEPWMRLSSPWRLSLLFFLSGVATAFMLRRSGASAALLRTRIARLGLPVLLGIVLVVPPQAYFEVRQFHGYGGSYIEFLRLYFGGYGGFCTPARGCLLLPTWNHLWFVVYLLVYTVLAWGLVRAWPALPERAARLLQAALAGARLWWLPVGGLAALRVALLDRFPPTHALVNDVYLHACYFGFFVAGVAMARMAAPWPRIESVRWVSLALALAGWLVMLAAPASSEVLGLPLARGLARTGFATMQWCAVLAALGFAHRHWNRDFTWRAMLTEAVFTVYLVHQTIIILLAVALAPLAWPAGVEGPLLVVATFALSAGCYALVRRVSVLRPWFGLAPQRVLPAPPHAAPEGAR